MGTPDFAVSILEALINSRHSVVGVVTQEDKPKGRSDKLIPPPVKECAQKYGIPVFQPRRIKDDEAVKKLREYEADIFVVAAYGQILSKEILEMPRFGCINTHASLLPKYRGAAPIQWAIVDGEEQTGVTIMQMDEGLDTGDILYTSLVDITNEDTGESLFDKLAESGASLITEALDRIEAGDITPIKQDESKATYAKILKKSMGELDFSKAAVSLERLVRGFTPWPGTYTHLRGKVLKVLKAESADLLDMQKDAPGADGGVPEGCVAGTSRNGLYVKTAEGYLVIRELQLEGKKRMVAGDFLMGCKVEMGEKLQ